MKLARPALLSIGTLAATVAFAGFPASAAPEVDGVRTPSGNIVCLGGEDGAVRCDISGFTYAPPPKPESCEFDWGGAFRIEPDGNVEMLCVSDTVLGEELPETPAGSSVMIGRALCTVEAESIRCVVQETDGGLYLSPGQYSTSFEEG